MQGKVESLTRTVRGPKLCVANKPGIHLPRPSVSEGHQQKQKKHLYSTCVTATTPEAGHLMSTAGGGHQRWRVGRRLGAPRARSPTVEPGPIFRRPETGSSGCTTSALKTFDPPNSATDTKKNIPVNKQPTSKNLRITRAKPHSSACGCACFFQEAAFRVHGDILLSIAVAEKSDETFSRPPRKPPIPGLLQLWLQAANKCKSKCKSTIGLFLSCVLAHLALSNDPIAFND